MMRGHFDWRIARSARSVCLLPAAAVVLAAAARAQTANPPTLDPIVVTATRHAARSFDVPASTDRIGADVIENAQPMVNLSETLVRVPGIVTFNRQNYAQDLQISSRGFGARAAFGVRGVRLYQDEIPVTMPDGQGQTGSFSLFSADSIEVLRGPFSTLYGNASGGVVSVTTEEGNVPPRASFNASAGSYRTTAWGAKLNGRTGDVGYVLAGQHFDTEGYRDHSSATRDVVNAKLTLAPFAGTRLTLIGGTQDQYRTEDPLGLNRAQWEANPRQVDPLALQFDTNKTIRQQQGGVSAEQQLGAATTLRVTGYGGHRGVRQYLALNGGGATASGGIVDLDRSFGGLGLRIMHGMRVGGQPLTLTAGIDADRLDEHRRGYVNNNGAMGDPRRDEDDRVTSVDAYAQLEWLPVDALSLTAGLRHSDVRFVSNDHYVSAQNPDDSGRRNFSHASPVAGAVWHAGPDLNVYASYGQGFETPTFAEMAYRPDGAGLNFGLRPATSKAAEVGVKTILARRHRINVAAFAIDTDDEIVTDTASFGRTTFRNASATRRRGAEGSWDASWDHGFTSRLAYTYLRATFTDAFRTGSPPETVAAGARLPGVPAATAYAELAWKSSLPYRPQAAIEVIHVDRIYVNDRNTDAAPRYTIANLRIGLEQQWPRVTLKEYVRLNNAFDRRYVGSVIVGDTNSRFFEPAPGRNWVAGLLAEARF